MSEPTSDTAPATLQSGTMKMLCGPADLSDLLRHSAMEFTVRVHEAGLDWTRPGAGTCTIPAAEIESVAQAGPTVAVTLKHDRLGGRVLTLGTASNDEAGAWRAALEAVRARPAPKPEPEPADASADDGPPCRITYSVDGAEVVEDFDLLVIACDPSALVGVCDYTAQEIDTFAALRRYQFHTTLVEVKVDPATVQKHGVIFAPGKVSAMQGSVYGFRNETAKQFGLKAAMTAGSNLVTVYQLRDGDDWTADDFQGRLKAEIATLSWWPFSRDYDIRASVTTPYFDHFDGDALRAGKPWAMLDRQGEKRTLLVHASTCFESAAHCWAYAALLLAPTSPARSALPRDKGARIAIVGAGVSGILFATRLAGLGYRNVSILENTDRHNGKTHTLVLDGPYPSGSHEPTVCELGTCYLSPAYDGMVAELRDFAEDGKRLDFLEGNDRYDFTGGDPEFRAIVTTDQLPPSFGVSEVVSFQDYVVLKAVAEMGLPNDEPSRALAQFKLLVDLAAYSLLHPLFVGRTFPMPPTRPESLDGRFGRQTFEDFLRHNGFRAMIGSLQYGYEVQGYGPLHTISAYYGLLWITPAVTWGALVGSLPRALAEALGLHQRPTVTALSKGWGNIWDQMVRKQALPITLEARITSIVRP